MTVCNECHYPHEGERCPNPACPAGKSESHRAHIAKVRAERERQRQADEAWTANFRRFYHRSSAA